MRAKTNKYELAVIGTGPAGLAAALYGGRLGLKVLAVGEVPGGTLNFTDRVENYPGFPVIKGRELARRLEKHARQYEVELIIDRVDRIAAARGVFRVKVGEETFSARTVILASGARAKKLGVPGEKKLTGKGVSYCALCDAPGFRGKEIALVGGGDSAVKEALGAAGGTKKIYLINNENSPRAESRRQQELNKLIASGKIEVVNRNQVVRIEGRDKVTAIELKNTFRSSRRLPVGGVLIYIGVVPNSSLAGKLGARLNRFGEVVVNRRCQTSLPGFFAAGDVTNNGWRQAIVAAAQGATAGWNSFRYCRNDCPSRSKDPAG